MNKATSCVLEKSSLFGRNLEQFEEIQNHFGWSEGVTRTKIGTWQTKNNTNEFPTIEEMKQYEKSANSILLDDLERQQEEEYNRLLSELRLSREKTDMFIINFMRNVINTNPRYKIDETKDDFVYYAVIYDNSYNTQDLESILRKIFGYRPKFLYNISATSSREDILKGLSEELDDWEENLLDILNNPIDLSSLYKDRNNIKDSIKVLQSYISRGLNSEGFSEHELQILNKINLKENHSKKQAGFQLQKLKSELKTAELKLQKANYIKYSTLLSAKNRLAALNAISNLKELVIDRITREIDSRTVKDSTYKQKVLHNIRLAKSIKNVLEFGSRTGESFIGKKEKEEISYDELINNIVSKHPEYRYLVKLFKEANPKLKIIIGGEAEYNANGALEGIIPGKFNPRYNTLYLTNSADIYTVIHELAHSATYYGLVGKEKEGNKTVEESINKFMDYIRDYIEDNQLNPSLFTEIHSDFFHISFKPSIYGFTNASEFIAELFGNPRFRDMLELIPPMEQKKFNSLLQEIWHTIIEALQRIFGKKADSNALQQAEKLGYTALLLQQNHLESIYETLDKYTNEAQNNVVNGYTSEMQQIKDQAIANGTFMKAPNGKPTNLNERQWLVVRTKAFKDWFGDWITIARLNQIENILLPNSDEEILEMFENTQAEYYQVLEQYEKLRSSYNLGEVLNFKSKLPKRFHKTIILADKSSKSNGAQLQNHEGDIYLETLDGTSTFKEISIKVFSTSFIKGDNLQLYNFNSLFPRTKETRGDIQGANLDLKSNEDVRNLLPIALYKLYKSIGESVPNFTLEGSFDSRSIAGKTFRKLTEDALKDAPEIIDFNTSNEEAIENLLTDITKKLLYVYYNINSDKLNIKFKNAVTSKILDDFHDKKDKYNSLSEYLEKDSSVFGFVSDLLFRAEFEINGKTSDLADVLYDANKTDNNPYENINASKVVDENGEPLVVYHHTDNPNLTEFSTDFENYFAKDGGTKEAIFFDENETGTLNRKYDIPVFLNIKDLHEYNETKEQLHQRGTTYRQVVNESAAANNIDGGVHMKDFDDNQMEHQSIWIVHNPNQIKSATDNIEFSRENNNIYHEHNKKPVDRTFKDNRLNNLKAVELTKFGTISLTKSPEKINRERWRIVWNIISSSSKFSTIADLLTKISKSNGILKQLNNVKIEVYTNKDIFYNLELQKAFGDSRAFYDPITKAISINIDAPFENNDSSSVLLHEVLHAVTLNLLASNPEQADKLRAILDDYRNNGGKRYKKEGVEGSEQYNNKEAVNLAEFVADIFSNEELINELKSIKTDQFTLWDRISQFFKDLFTGELFKDIKDDTLMAKASNELLNLLELPLTKEMVTPAGTILHEGESQEFYTKQALDDYINDLVLYDIKREDITISYTPETEDTDEYWTVSYNKPTSQEPTIAEPLFKEEPSTGYRERTIKNAKADATIALAVDFNSAGERLTKKAVIDNGKKYIPVNTNNPEITDELVNSIVDQLNEVNAKSLNIAGNGIYTLKGKYTQEQVDEYVYNLLNRVLNHPNLQTKIETIRSGGQTGYDEAGIKAAMRLGIRNGILAPKGWKFRDVNGRDISDEQAFKARFNIQPQQAQQEVSTEQPIDTHQEKETVDMTLDRQMKQVWTPTVLNSRIIRVTQIFKDIVTKLENQLDEKEQLATSAATRQYLITTKYGAKNILNKVREEIQKTYANRDWVENFVHELYDEEDWNTQEVTDKINYIYQQGQYMLQFFEPLIMEASTEIKRLEKVSILTNDGEIIQDDFEEDNVKAEEAVLSKHEEGWFIENHEQSVESTLSSEVKTILNNLYEKDSEGFQTRFDDLEQPIPLDYRVALGTCLYIVGNCTSDAEMITALQEASAKSPWLQDVVNILMGIDTETSKYYEGLSKEDIELKAFNMRALFWHDMHKVFVNIAEQSTNDKGEITTEIKNKVEGKDALDADFEDNCYNNKVIFNEDGKPYKMVYNADGSFNKTNYDNIHTEILQSELYQHIPTGKVSEDELDLIERALKSFGANISKEAITNLFTTGTNTQWSTLHSIIFGFYNAKQASNQPLQSVIGEEKANIYDAFREKYDMLSTLFANTAEGRDESSVYITVDGESKRLFSRIFPNRIHTLFNRLLNRDRLSEKDYKARLNEKYGRDWWYAAENPDGETPSFTGVLKDLWTSKEDRQKIKIKTLKASQGISYADEIDAQAEETRLNEFEATKSEGFADYSVPTFSDTGESYYATMRYFDIHNTEQKQELITRLTDVIRQEIRRIKVVRERARINKETIEAGLPAPINTIACWDIDLEKGEVPTDGTNFHFFPALNRDKETFLRKFNELSNNPAAQQQLLERAVIYALNEEFKTYLNFYNQTQVNQLPKSKHTETGNKQFIDYIKATKDSRKDNPLNSAQLTAINVIINRLQNDTLHPDEFASLKEQAKTILTSNITDEQRRNVIEASIDSFQEDVSNLNKLEDYLWNYFYAQTQIINLTIKDPAFLGTADKVQKRYKMYYSPVQTAYTQEYDLDVFRETGELVEIPEKFAKKTEYSLILTDDIIDQVYSFDNLKSLIDKKVEDGYLTKEQAVEILSNLSDVYAKTKGKRAEINLADAQCYRTLPSWQKCLNMIGKGYNKKMQQSINRLMNPDEYGDWSYEDFHNVWEIFKPFVASDMSSPSGVENLGSQYAEVSMPVMHKNAEFLLLAMYNRLSGVMKDNWKLKALNEFMVKHGIDKAQFESAVKLGSQGAININNCTTPEEVISTLEIATGLTENKQAEEGNKQVVHSIPFEDWGISTSMPEHLLDHPESSMGTQLMKIITEGLSENPDKTLKVGDRTMTYAQWLEEYQALQIANLMDDFAEVGKIFNNNEELVTYLKKQILTQNKYSHELLHHLELDENGNFKYPLIDPMLRNQFDALCSSLIRNNVTKRKRRMGALPQVAAFGFEEDLQIRCTDRNGTLLLTKKEFEEQGSNIQGIETWEAYKEYCDHNATNIAYMEVYMPPFDTTLMRKINDACIYKEDVHDKNGKLLHRSGEFNHQLFNKIFAKKLLNGLANRVPTETKHSMIPIYVKGFLPAQNSSCVVVPAEWIAISDSDNDGDKLYCYFYHSKAVIGNIPQMKRDWASQHNWIYLSKAQRDEMRASVSNYRTDNFKKSEELDADWETPEEFSTNKELKEFKKQAFKNPKYVSSIEPIEFKIEKLERLAGEDDIIYQHRCEMASISSNSFEARNNRMLDLERAVLQTDENSVQMLIPGGFPILKHVVNDVIKPLYDVTKSAMSICNPATRTIQQIRNMAGANLIGIYANHRSFRPLLERAKCTLHADYQPTINGNESLPRENGNLTWSLSSSTNAKGEFISDNISNFSGASVDNAKDPLLSWLAQNTITAPLSLFLIHCGYTLEEIALFMNQPSIKKAVRKSFITGESLEKIVKRDYQELKKTSTGLSGETASQLLNSTMKDQIKRETEGILPTAEDNMIQMVVLENLMAIMPASRAIQNLINVTKADTQVGALQAKSSENKSKLLLYDKIISEVSNEDYPIIGAEALVPESVSIEDITSNRKSLTTIENATSGELALTAAFRSLGVESIEGFTKDISMTFTKLVDKVLDVAMEHYKGLTLNAETVEALTHAATSYVFSDIAALNKGNRLKRFNMALSVLRDVKNTELGRNNILLRDLVVNVNGNKYSKNMPFIKLKRLNNNYTATENYRRAWEDLIVNGNKTVQLKDRTITYKQLSNLLFNYCFMVSGLAKRGNSFINCFPTAYISQIEGYNELLQRIPNMDITNDIANNIFEQYIANHPEDSKFVHRINKEDFDIKGFLDKSKVVPDVIRIGDFTKATGWYDTMTVMGSEVRVPYDFITFTDENGKRYLYKGFSNETNDMYYQRVSVLGNSRNGYLEEYELGKTIDLVNGVQSIIADNMSWFTSTNVKTEVEAKVQEANIQGRTLSTSEYKELYTRLLGDSSGIKVTLNDYSASEEDATGMKFCAII